MRHDLIKTTENSTVSTARPSEILIATNVVTIVVLEIFSSESTWSVQPSVASVPVRAKHRKDFVAVQERGRGVVPCSSSSIPSPGGGHVLLSPQFSCGQNVKNFVRTGTFMTQRMFNLVRDLHSQISACTFSPLLKAYFQKNQLAGLF